MHQEKEATENPQQRSIISFSLYHFQLSIVLIGKRIQQQSHIHEGRVNGSNQLNILLNHQEKMMIYEKEQPFCIQLGWRLKRNYIFETLQDTGNTYEEELAKLDEDLDVKKNVQYERSVFREDKQESQESLD